MATTEELIEQFLQTVDARPATHVVPCEAGWRALVLVDGVIHTRHVVDWVLEMQYGLPHAIRRLGIGVQTWSPALQNRSLHPILWPRWDSPDGVKRISASEYLALVSPTESVADVLECVRFKLPLLAWATPLTEIQQEGADAQR